MKRQPKVIILILNWNGLPWLKKCFPSVLKTDYSNFEVILVDNSSQDDSVKWINTNYPAIKIIKNKKNFGFAKGYNIGIKYAIKRKPDYIALINTDVKVDPQWLKELLRVSESNKDIGVIGPMIYEFDGKTIDSKKFESEPLLSIFYKSIDGPINNNYRLSFCDGATLLVKRATINKIGLMDPNYFFFWDVTDWERRALFAGFKTVQVFSAKVYHKKHGSSRINKQIRKKIIFSSIKNKYYYILKDPFNNFIFNVYCFNKDFLKEILIKIKQQGLKILSVYLRAYLWNVFNLPFTFFKRYVEILKIRKS